jgi:hypothetical protein
MNPKNLRTEAAWLQELVGETCPWPIETAHGLREFALNIATSPYYEDNLPGPNYGG